MDHPSPISLPADWDAQKDCEHFQDRWEPVPSYTEALWQWMRFHHGVLVRTLDSTLDYLRRRDATLVHVEPRCLTPDEKIGALREIARASAAVSGYRERLIEALNECEFAESERRRVLTEYRRAGEHAWMYPVIEAIDLLGGAAFLLDEAMLCENADYRDLNSRERFGDAPGDEDPEGMV